MSLHGNCIEAGYHLAFDPWERSPKGVTSRTCTECGYTHTWKPQKSVPGRKPT